MKRAILLVVLVHACSDPKLKSPYPPLLGTRSETMVKRFESACDEQFATVDPENNSEPNHPFARLTTHRDEVSEEIKCEMSSSSEYGIGIVAGHVVYLDVQAPTAADRLKLFERVFAASVPAEVREPMRRSIYDPTHFEFWAANAHVDAETTGNRITWTVRPGGK